MEYYAAIKRNEFISFAGTWIKPEAIILSKLTQEQKNQTLHFLTHKWKLNNEKQHALQPATGEARGWVIIKSLNVLTITINKYTI